MKEKKTKKKIVSTAASALYRPTESVTEPAARVTPLPTYLFQVCRSLSTFSSTGIGSALVCPLDHRRPSDYFLCLLAIHFFGTRYGPTTGPKNPRHAAGSQWQLAIEPTSRLVCSQFPSPLPTETEMAGCLIHKHGAWCWPDPAYRPTPCLAAGQMPRALQS